MDTVYTDSSHAQTSECPSHRGSFQLFGHDHYDFRGIFIFSSHSDLNVDSEKTNLSLTAICFCCFIFQRSQGASLTEAKFLFSSSGFCFFSLCDSRLGFSLASGFCTYSVLPNSFSLNIAQVLLQWQHINFGGLFFLRKPNI